MTRKDYVAIAAALKDELTAWNGKDALQAQAAGLTVGYVAQRIANVLASDNPRFDRARFLTACGL